MLVLSSDLIDAMKDLFGYNGYLANVAMMAIIEISAMLAIISRNSGAFKLKVHRNTVVADLIKGAFSLEEFL